MRRAVRRGALAAAIAFAAFVALVSVSLAQWPTACVDLNEVVELQLGNNQNARIYQRVFLGADAERACQVDHRDDVRATFAWAFDGTTPATDLPSTAWPTSCVGLNDVVEAHLGTSGNVGIYQRAFGDGPAAESSCRSDHHADVRAMFAWAYGPPAVRLPRLTLPGGSPMALEDMADVMLASPWADAVVYLKQGDTCGSGFVVTSDGYIVTNDHVVDQGHEVFVGSPFWQTAVVVASDPELDLALIKVPDGGEPYPFFSFGMSTALRYGDGVMILGFPGCGASDSRFTASWGGVTEVNVWDTARGSEKRIQSIRTSAETEMGSSGSPALDARGRVIGVAWAGGDDGTSLVPGDAVRRTVATWLGALPLPTRPAVTAPPVPTSAPPPPASTPAPPPPVPTHEPSRAAASRAVVNALGSASDALQDHFDAIDEFNYEINRAAQELSWGWEATAGLALRSAADYQETAARELDAAARELDTVVFLLRAHSLPNHEWALYLESASGDLRWAATHLRNAAFYNRLVSWNLRDPQTVNNLDNANLALDSYERSIVSATSSLELWSISAS